MQSISLHTAASLSVYCLAGWRGALLCMQHQTVSTGCAALVAHTRVQLSATGRQVCATGDLQVIYTQEWRDQTPAILTCESWEKADIGTVDTMNADNKCQGPRRN